MSSWSLVSTVNESPEILSVFVDHHLRLGCGELHLYFDNPDDPAKQLFTSNPKVLVRNSVRSATSHERKQSRNALKAYQECRTEWLIHLDADELIHAEAGVGKVLSELPGEVRLLNLAPWEAVFRDLKSAGSPFSTDLFRRALRPAATARRLQDTCYPGAGESMRLGLTGHSAGKSFIRKTSGAVRPTVHFWKSEIPGETIPVHRRPREIRLLHFDALSFPLWKKKLERRVKGDVVMKGMDPHRLKQLEAFNAALATGTGQALENLFTRLYVIPPAQRDSLKGLGSLKQLEWRAATQPPTAGILASFARKVTRRLPFLRNSSPPPSEDNARTSEGSLSLKEARRLLEDGQPDHALAVLRKAIDPAALSRESYEDVIEIQQLAAWLLIRSGDCSQARVELERIGVDLAGDFRKKRVVTPDFQPRRMVFICGLHRSGTTLLEQWLHAGYSCSTLRARVPENEGQFLQDVYCDERPFGGPGKFAFSQNMHGMPPHDQDTAREHERRIRQAWEKWVHGNDDVLLEKSPPNITRIAYLRTVFPGSRFIIWTRDPRAVSLATLKWSKTSYQELLLHWHAAYSAALVQMDDDCLVARYEDFSENPDEEIGKIAAFAGLSPRLSPLPLPDRFKEIRNTNEAYLRTAPTHKVPLPFRSWKSFGYDFD